MRFEINSLSLFSQINHESIIRINTIKIKTTTTHVFSKEQKKKWKLNIKYLIIITNPKQVSRFKFNFSF